MNTAYAILHNRVEEVINETVQMLSTEVQAGRIKSDAAIDKVQHLVNTIRKFMDSADAQAPASFTDHEAAPSSSSVDVVNLINMPASERQEVMTVETNPQIGFVRLSFGFVNMHQVALLDVPAKQLFLVGGIMRSLDREDVVKLVFHTKLYQLR